jgi:hypothetical protein
MTKFKGMNVINIFLKQIINTFISEPFYAIIVKL